MNYEIPAKYRKPHYSTRLCRAQYNYISLHYSKELIEKICTDLKVPLDYLLQDDNWVSEEFVRDFLAQIIEKTGDDNISEKFGRFTVSPEAVNFIEYTLNKSLLSPEVYYLSVPMQYKKYNNVNSIKLKKWRFGFFQYEVKPLHDFTPSIEVCKNTVGLLSEVATVFEIAESEIKHPNCIHNGDANCVFEVSYAAKEYWKNKSLSLFKNMTAMGIFVFLLFKMQTQTKGTLSHWILFLSDVLVSLGFFAAIRYFSLLKYIQQYNDQSRKKSAELYENYKQLERKYKEASLTSELSARLNHSDTSKNLIETCLDDLHVKFGYHRSIMMLLSADKTRLYTASARGLEKGGAELYQLSIKYPAPSHEPQLFANILENGKTRSIFNIDEFKVKLKSSNQKLLDALGVNSLIISPIQDNIDKYGLLVIGSTDNDRHLAEEDTHLLENISRFLSLSFQKANQLEKEQGLRTLFQKYVPAIVLDGVNQLSGNNRGLLPRACQIVSIFIDLRDFTQRCEKLAPEKIVEMLNLYTEYVTSRISASGGIIDKLVGDGINAFFVQDSKNPNTYLEASFYCVCKILADLDELEEIYQRHGFGSACIGIGYNAGKATMGSMGSDKKLDYTAVGDTVNLASRLQDLSKNHRINTPSAMQGLILTTDKTFKLGNFALSPYKIGVTRIRGRTQSEEVLMIDKAQAIKYTSFSSLKKAA